MRFQASQVIERPVATVFRFVADNHVRNHSRWDPDVELEQISDGPMGVGTAIRRRVSRYGTPVEGTMEVVEFERDRALGSVIHDGPIEMRGGMAVEAVAPDRTNLTIFADVPGANEGMARLITSRMERSVGNIKQLIETET